MSFPNRIYLTGFMASGKTTVGRLLARQLGLPFVDLDTEIERSVGTPIPQIFDRDGEAAFRRLERSALECVSDGGPAVVSTGGGALAADPNIELARKTGVVIYLRASVATIIDRLASRAHARPLVASVSRADLPQYVEDLIARRRSYYEQAHIVVDVDGRSRKSITGEIRRALRDHQG